MSEPPSAPQRPTLRCWRGGAGGRRRQLGSGKTEKYERRIPDGTWSHAEVIRLRTPADLDAFTARHA
ncbi:MAG TPA: hypothetical protein VGK49_01470 [Ilumatobacteraceae bacterium]